MKKRINFILAAIFLLGTVSTSFALDVDEIVEKANLVSYYAGDDGRASIKMTIVDSQQRERIREFKILRLDVENGGEQKFYVYFKKPSDVAGMAYLVVKNIGRDDDRWLYLPALDLVRRIASSDKRSSFVGSHFLYEDISGRGLEADTHELVSEEENMYKVKNVPKETKGVEFSYYFVWIDKENFVPMKAEYYDDKDSLIRKIEVLDVKDVAGNPTVIKSRATDLVRGGETTLEFTDVEYNIGLTDNIFKERYLRKAPTEWIE